MAVYSHSKVTTFENCPYHYKLAYIEKPEVEVAETIETFMGKKVHETLEKLYKDKKFKKPVSKAILLKFYRENWEKEYSNNILVVKDGLTAENYRRMGLKFISDYYDRMKPFDQLTILDLETQDMMILPDGNRWHVRIDKFACDKSGNYYVCDYKTNSRMKDQEEADSDRQLAMYSIWVKDKFQDAKSVKLIWHMLAFDKDVISERNEEQLKKLQEEVMQIIKKIQEAEKKDNFPTNVTALCDYCKYKSICPAFKHQVELAEKNVKEFKEDEGVKFVDEFAEIRLKKREIEDKEDELKNNLIGFAKQKGIEIVYGSNMKCSVKDWKKVIIPDDKKEELIKLLKEKNLWSEFEMLNYMKFNSQGRKGELDKEVMDEIEIGEDIRISLSKRKDVNEEE